MKTVTPILRYGIRGVETAKTVTTILRYGIRGVETVRTVTTYSGIVANRMYLLGTKFVAAVDHKPLLPL